MCVCVCVCVCVCLCVCVCVVSVCVVSVCVCVGGITVCNLQVVIPGTLTTVMPIACAGSDELASRLFLVSLWIHRNPQLAKPRIQEIQKFVVSCQV